MAENATHGVAWLALLDPDVLDDALAVEQLLGRFADIRMMPIGDQALGIALERLGARSVPDDIRASAGGSPWQTHALTPLWPLLERLATVDAPVLVQGERGTARRLAAAELHRRSSRSDGPMVTVACETLEDGELDARLSGHFGGESAGGVFQAAANGSLVIHEIDLLPPAAQEALAQHLRRTELGSDDVSAVFGPRVLATCQADLAVMVRQGRFREDLYYQLNIQISTVPLRERKADIALLAQRMLDDVCASTGRDAHVFSERARVALAQHDWPSNLRELRGRVLRALALEHGIVIEAADLGLGTREQEPPAPGILKDYLFRAERQALCDVLVAHSDNLSQAAKVLGISRPTFYRLLQKHQIH